MPNKDHIEKLLKTHRRRLQILQEQKAKMGAMTPPHIQLEIEDINEEIERLLKELGSDIDVAGETDDKLNIESEQKKEVFISYAWGGQSEKLVNRLDAAFQDKGITIIRDKREVGFKGRIKEFMERIGRGKAVIVVVSDRYLKSENCMFELVQIAKNGQFYDRIFPIVLPDAKIYKAVDRIKYIKYWEDRIQELDEAMKSVSAANLQGIREDIDLYTEIRATIASLVDILKDMNTLTPEMHSESGFSELFNAVEQKLR